MSAGKNVVESFRDVVQDLLVPEQKALRASVEGLHTEIGFLRAEMKLRDEKMEQLLRSNNERLEQIVRLGDERNEHSIRALAQKFDDAVEIRERLATIEARMPRQ